MKSNPLSRLRGFPPLSARFALREGGRSLRGGAALARLPSNAQCRFLPLCGVHDAIEKLKVSSFPLLSAHASRLRVGGRSLRGGAALARLPSNAQRRFLPLCGVHGVIKELKEPR